MRYEGRFLSVEAFLLPVELYVLAAVNAASSVLHPGEASGQLGQERLADFLWSYRVLDREDETIGTVELA